MLTITAPHRTLTLCLRGGLILKLFEAHDRRSRAYWCRADGRIVRWITPPLV